MLIISYIFVNLLRLIFDILPIAFVAIIMYGAVSKGKGK